MNIGLDPELDRSPRLGLDDAAWKRLAHALRQEPRGKLMQVLRCLAAGYSDDRIMETLDIDLGTVREYLGRLFRRLKCPNRTGAVGAALEAMGRMMREGIHR